MRTYDDIAEWYDAWVGTQATFFSQSMRTVESLLGEIAGQRVGDLACGQGRVTRYLADLGAHLVGIDFSAKLLDIARGYEETTPRGIEYFQADAQSLDSKVHGLFDGVICFMALMDIPDLAPTLHSVARILQPAGWFVFSILHPCFHTSQSGVMETPEGAVRTIGRYFVEGYWRSDTRTGPPGKIGAYHRTLSTYVNALTDAGLQLVHFSEPRTADPLPDSLSLARLQKSVWAEVPSFLVASCRKGTPKQSV